MSVAGQSFDEFVASRQAHLIRLGYLMVHDHQLAQDLAQEGLARLHVHWRKVSRDGNPDAYVRRIMVNQLLSWRRRRSWGETATDQLPELVRPDDQLAQFAERDELWPKLSALPPRQRVVLVLRFYEDLDDAAIAAILGCSPVTVRTHSQRGLARLRDTLDNHPLTGG